MCAPRRAVEQSWHHLLHPFLFVDLYFWIHFWRAVLTNGQPRGDQRVLNAMGYHACALPCQGLS